MFKKNQKTIHKWILYIVDGNRCILFKVIIFACVICICCIRIWIICGSLLYCNKEKYRIFQVKFLMFCKWKDVWSKTKKTDGIEPKFCKKELFLNVWFYPFQVVSTLEYICVNLYILNLFTNSENRKKHSRWWIIESIWC